LDDRQSGRSDTGQINASPSCPFSATYNSTFSAPAVHRSNLSKPFTRVRKGGENLVVQPEPGFPQGWRGCYSQGMSGLHSTKLREQEQKQAV
jgi:hypothetical protein